MNDSLLNIGYMLWILDDIEQDSILAKIHF